MTELFAELGIEITKDNRDQIDEIIHDMLSVDYPNSAAAWKQVRKKLDSDDCEGFKQRLKVAISRMK
jgi:predicted amino acid-binding ACT domain protein